MPLTTFSGVDLSALLDVDSREAKAFTTYMGYWVALAAHINEAYGRQPYGGVLADLQQRRVFKRLSGGRRPDPEQLDQARAFLLSGWVAELKLHIICLDDPARLRLANHGAPIDAYYATSRHASAFLLLRDQNVPMTHRGLLNAASGLVHGTNLMPAPWNLHCLSTKPSPVYGGFPTPPGACSNLALGVDRHDVTGMLLRTTRDRGIADLVDKSKRERKLKKAPAGEAARCDSRLAPTTLFDFAWRMRHRSNYGDPALFYVGALDDHRTRLYAEAVRTWTAATMFLFEALLAQRARPLLEDAAVHFISRDRTDLSKQLIVPRLKALGALA